jgi:predicted RND superfamily exporter protein
VSLALISCVANVMPVMLPVAAMGFLGVRIDGPAAFTMSVALGVCVDDTIHFFSQFNRARREGRSTADALRYVMRHVGGAITSTTVILLFGFSVMMMSDFRANAMIGYLGCFMVVLAWAVEFLVTPALLSIRFRDAAASRPRR